MRSAGKLAARLGLVLVLTGSLAGCAVDKSPVLPVTAASVAVAIRS